MSKTFHLTVARLGENLFDGEAVSVSLPGADGVFQVLPHHEALISELKEGQIEITGEDNQKQRIALATAGIAEVSHNQATVLL
jgi:F-type H+-transporting ATPase subunit epsilon